MRETDAPRWIAWIPPWKTSWRTLLERKPERLFLTGIAFCVSFGVIDWWFLTGFWWGEGRWCAERIEKAQPILNAVDSYKEDFDRYPRAERHAQ